MDLVDRHAAELAEEVETAADEAAEVRTRPTIDEADVAAKPSAGRPELDLEPPFAAPAGDGPVGRATQLREEAGDGPSAGEEIQHRAER
ncbi:MAG: hypothetical protein R3A79_29910 [Nannocystaceae bacterium]